VPYDTEGKERSFEIEQPVLKKMKVSVKSHKVEKVESGHGDQIGRIFAYICIRQ
jgi:hypothetical protein